MRYDDDLPLYGPEKLERRSLSKRLLLGAGAGVVVAVGILVWLNISSDRPASPSVTSRVPSLMKDVLKTKDDVSPKAQDTSGRAEDKGESKPQTVAESRSAVPDETRESAIQRMLDQQYKQSRATEAKSLPDTSSPPVTAPLPPPLGEKEVTADILPPSSARVTRPRVERKPTPTVTPPKQRPIVTRKRREQDATLRVEVVPDGPYVVQFASLGSRGQALRYADSLRAKVPSILGPDKLPLRVTTFMQSSPNGTRITYYRVQGIAFARRASAMRVCNYLRDRSYVKDCFVMRRNK